MSHDRVSEVRCDNCDIPMVEEPLFENKHYRQKFVCAVCGLNHFAGIKNPEIKPLGDQDGHQVPQV
jgi:hypothetical protein